MLSGDQKGDLIGQLERAKEHDEIELRNMGHNSHHGRQYRERINEITNMITGLRSGANYPMGEVREALREPGEHHHHH